MTRILTALALLLVLLAGCGGSSSPSSSSSKPVNPNTKEVSPNGDIPDNQAYVPYSPPGADYQVKVPEGWARTIKGGAVTFTDKLNSIRMEERSAQAAPSAAVARSAEIPRLKQSVKGFQSPKVSTVNRNSGPAVRITYLADAQADPVTQRTGTNAVERYLFSRNGKQVVLTLSGPKGADNVDPWKLVTDSLSWSR
ncbi:MAG: hypothetical protein QOC68_2688 [Solirubrobacteraceae bacterium]|jgi:hypothetical protein|nr:hypothetical protein [Solirubrobacteraceae bacterium]